MHNFISTPPVHLYCIILRYRDIFTTFENQLISYFVTLTFFTAVDQYLEQELICW